MSETFIQREVQRKVKNYIVNVIGEKSANANLIQFTIRRLVNELITGKTESFKDDTRAIEKGTKVLFIAKDKTQIEGTIVKVCIDTKVSNQKYYIVSNPITGKNESKAAAKILTIVK